MQDKEMNRMWINQPSTHDSHHDLHGTNVLAQCEYGDTMRVFFLSGNVISQQFKKNDLSMGWKPQGKCAIIPIEEV